MSLTLNLLHKDELVFFYGPSNMLTPDDLIRIYQDACIVVNNLYNIPLRMHTDFPGFLLYHSTPYYYPKTLSRFSPISGVALVNTEGAYAQGQWYAPNVGNFPIDSVHIFHVINPNGEVRHRWQYSSESPLHKDMFYYGGWVVIRLTDKYYGPLRP